MSATDDDTELRDLLIQNLENSGVLNKLKAEMRAAVFLAMDEQDKVENKTPLVNENLKKCLNTKDGRLVASLIIDFLQVFHLDFTLAVFQPEINSLNGLDSREQVSCELGITETDMNRNTPLLLELVKRGRHREKNSIFSEELTPRQIADARKKFDSYDKASTAIDFQEFLGLYKRFFSQCRSVVTHDTSDVIYNPSRFIEEKINISPASKGVEVSHSHSDTSLRFGSLQGKGQGHVTSMHSEACGDNDNGPTVSLKKGLDLEVEEDADEDDSFVRSLREESLTGRSFNPMRRGTSLNDLSALGSDTEGEQQIRTQPPRGVLQVGGSTQEKPITETSQAAETFDEITQDFSVSQLSQSQGADYMEEVA
ncbi:unnamed protein product [Coregonus sp. 'balchen']|nr:unnamed protein product [Coregonus sp. 'balchen']